MNKIFVTGSSGYVAAKLIPKLFFTNIIYKKLQIKLQNHILQHFAIPKSF
jgi:hypothetical protein